MIMPEVTESFAIRFKKNDLSFYCLFLILSLSAACGFVFSVTLQTVIFIILISFLAFLFINKKIKNRALLIVLLPLAAALISYLGADFQVNVRNTSLGLLNASIAFFIMIYANLKNKENILLTFVFLGLWISFLLFIRFFTGADYGDPMLLNINVLSGFLLLVYPLTLGFVEKNKSPLVFIVIAFVIFFAVILTNSRTVIVLAYAATAFYFLKLKNNKNFKIFFVIVSAVMVAGIVYAFYMKAGWNSFSGRFIWWKTALLMFKDSPLSGIGFGNYGALFTYYRPEPVLNTLFAHNIFLQIAAETGIAGILCFASAFYIVIKNTVISFKNKSNDFVHLKAVCVSVLLFLIFNITEYSFYIPVCLIAFFALCGFLCNSEIEKRNKKFPYWLIILPVLFFVSLSLFPALAERYYEQGKRYAANKDYEKAKESYLKSVKYDPKNPEYLHFAADCNFKLYIMGSRNEESYLDETIKLELQSEKLYMHSAQIKAGIANLYSLKGDNENAKKYFAAARAADKFNPNYGNFVWNE